MLHSQILTPWNSNNDLDLSTWIWEQPCMQMDFWQFSRNAYICIIPGKLLENHLHAWLFSNPCEQVLKSMKFRGQICPVLLRRKRTFPHWLENSHACKWILVNFPGIIHMSAFWKMVRNPFACMVVLLSMWKGPSQCWKFMESGSESATYLFITKKRDSVLLHLTLPVLGPNW